VVGNDVTDDHVDLAPLTGGHETVLIVEDNEQLRRVTVQGLRMLGYQVLEAANAECALDMLAAHKDVELLFTDIVMPGDIDGPELAARAARHRPHLKVLLTSGFPDMRGSGKARTDAASRYRLLAKPYRYDELAKSVREALDERQAEDAETTEECACAC
jgi:DNA-binding NtrC family response regulator